MVVKVVFGNGGKIYAYNTNLTLLLGGTYDIITSSNGGSRGYDSYSKAPRKPEKPYKQVVVNESKRTICVVWKDGTRTVMKCHPDDEWDEEKGIAMCFMKKVFDNRGCYYDTFRDITYMGD